MQANRNRALDGLRAFAVGLVVVYHAAPWPADTPLNHHFRIGDLFAETGPHGVRLFFVLSGFLITGILLDARTRADSEGVATASVWRAFVMRRALRIFPLSYVALTLAWLVGVPAMREHPYWWFGYASDLLVSYAGRGGAVGHFWTLAVEEQFYLVWPFLILWLPRPSIPSAVGTVVLGSVLARIATVALIGPEPAYYLPWCRLDSLAFGAWLTLNRPRVDTLVIWAGVLFAAGALLREHVAWRVGVNELAFVVASGALIIAVARGWAQPIFQWPPLVYVGTISYGIYIWHVLLPALLPGLFPDHRGLALLSAMTIGSVVVASLSWYAFEEPLNNLKRHFPYVGPATTRSRRRVTSGWYDARDNHRA